MGISSYEFLQYVIQPTLRQLGVESPVAGQLLLATAHYQSGMGRQLQSNQGIGVYGISAELHTEVWDRYLALDCDLASQVRGMASQHEFPKAPHTELLTNLSYATAIAWMIYLYRGVKIPDADDPHTMARCWQACFPERPPSDRDAEEFSRRYTELMMKHAATRLAA